VSGTATPSVAVNIISRLDKNSTEEDLWVARAVLGMMYLGGADTVTFAFKDTYSQVMTTGVSGN